MKIIKKIKRKIEYIKLGGFRLFLITILDRINKTNNIQKYVYKICENAKESDYPRILKSLFYISTMKKLVFSNPKTMNEKIQWLKLYDNSVIRTRCSDKYLCREFVTERIGDEYLIPLLGCYDSADKIDFNLLPNQFVIKCSHGSGFNILVKDKSNINKEEIINKLNEWMGINYAYFHLELQYKNIKPLIIVEKYIEDSSRSDLVDYKFFCVDGYVDCVMMCLDRNTGDTKFTYYDKDWNYKKYDTENDIKFEKPKEMNLMIELASKLSKGFKFVRVDLYLVDGNIYFGEMTFTPGGGLMTDHTRAFDEHIGSLIKLQ